VGLPAKDRDRLTEPYVTTREKGTGLGLAIVKRILEDHGGELELADARSGQGALAILRLPAAPAQRVVSPAAAVSAE
jgi:two-component system, NtrC family, nitrogen regulation sensor histidine kinase NtrY